jgi:amino acid adenylation domain-containing protein
MTVHDYNLEALDAKAKRELLAQLLRQKAVESGEPFPLSLGQEALWFLHESAPENPAYNLAFCARVRATVDANRLETALLKVMERHPMLRCTFIGSGPQLQQRVQPVPQNCLEFVDASCWSEEELQARVQQSFDRPFDLVAGPVFRATLFSRHDTNHVLLIAVHHIVFDGYSFGYLLNELGALYEGNQVANLPFPGSYAEFVNWQRAMLESEEGNKAWNYWRGRLHSLSQVDLPSDYLRPSTRKMVGATHHFELDASLSARLREFARDENVTPFMVLATAFHALLHRYTGAAEVPIGVPLAGRSRREFQDTIGYFINPVVVSAPVQADTTFRQHLATLRDVTVAAQQYGDFPFIELVKRLQPVRDTGRTPFFEITLNLIKTTQFGVTPGQMLHDENGAPLQLGSLQLEAFPLRQQEGLFDLDVNFLDTGGIIPATIKYNTQLFVAETVARLAQHLLTLLSAGLVGPNQKIPELPLLTADERHEMLVEWNATTETYPEVTLHQFIEEQVDRFPDAIAAVSGNANITYSELDSRANQIAHTLRSMGIGPEAIVAVCLDRSIDMVAAFLGVLKSGAAYLPVDVSYPADRIAYILQDANVSAIIAASNATTDLPDGSVPLVLLGNARLEEQPSARPPDTASPDNAAYVIYTSGSTGKPKGVVLEHRGIVNHLLWMRSRWPLSVGDAFLQCASPSFDASVFEVWNALATGARLVIANTRGYADPGYLARCIIVHQVTHALIVPSVLEVLAQHPDFARCTSLRCLFAGGEALKHSLVQLLRSSRQDIEIVNLYGPTEATINATFWVTKETESTLAPIEPIGRPIANDRTYILDPALNPVPIGVPGELHIAGASVGRGYLRRPDLTAERFIPDPFTPGGRAYKTGDVCRFRPDGVIEYLGRNDRQVKVRGFRIELGEIEAALCAHSSIRQAAVIAREDAPGDLRLTAYLVPTAGDNPTGTDLRSFLRDRLPEYMIPAAFVVMPSLPITSSGKLDVKTLPVPDAPRRPATQCEAPRSEIESAIAAMWKDVLRVDQVGVHDNFFDLGGHSLLLVKLQECIEQHLNRRLEIVDLFQYPTIETLAHHLTSHDDASSQRDRIRRQAERQKEAANRMRVALGAARL